MIFGGIETGGTKTVCAVGSGPNDIREEARFQTDDPDATISGCIDLFKRWQPELAAVGIASFGPVDLNPESATYGYVTTTPKPNWQYINLVGQIRDALGVPINFDTDCNGAALGEHQWGAAMGLDTFVYLTVGTGIGGGGMVGGHLIHGLLHPEMGHVSVPHDLEQDPYQGWCPYHGDCLEGLAAGPALEGRWRARGEVLPADHPAWPLEAQYLASGIINVIYVLSPQLVILGGGVMDNDFLHGMVRSEVLRQMNGYLRVPKMMDDIEQFYCASRSRQQIGCVGSHRLSDASDMKLLPVNLEYVHVQDRVMVN